MLLQHMADMSPVDRRVGHLHIEVPDVDAAYRRPRGQGRAVQPPAPDGQPGRRLELWAATFRDPDGHGIALTEWRAATSLG